MVKKVIPYIIFILVVGVFVQIAKIKLDKWSELQEPQKIEVEQTDNVIKDTTKINYVGCCPVCGSNERMTYHQCFTDELRDDWIMIDNVKFVICANCGNMYAIKGE